MNRKELVKPHPMIPNIMEKYGTYIQQTQIERNIISNNLRLLLALHLFKYSVDDLYFDKSYYRSDKIRFDIIRAEIDFLCENIIIPNRELYLNLYKETLPKIEKTCIVREDTQLYEANEKTKEKYEKIYFKEVNRKDGILIQDKLHYIGHHRADTRYHFGLFREGAKIPFAYSAYSILDRNYLLNLPYFNHYAPNSILVNTRNFGFKDNPHDSMSVLFKEALKYIRENSLPFECMVSAINPNLMFDASSYFASNFRPIATSPLNYAYINGIYATRRQLEKGETKYMRAKTSPNPVIWFAKTIYRKNYKIIDRLIKEHKIIDITKDEYSKK